MAEERETEDEEETKIKQIPLFLQISYPSKLVELHDWTKIRHNEKISACGLKVRLLAAQ